MFKQVDIYYGTRCFNEIYDNITHHIIVNDIEIFFRGIRYGRKRHSKKSTKVRII